MRALLVLVTVGFAAQLVDGALGMAYGATSSSLVLAYGLSPAMASASVHMAELGTTLASGVSHWRFGNVEWQTVRRIAIPGAVGAFLGAVVLSSVSSELARPWMAGVLLLLGGYILVRFTLGRPPQAKGTPYFRIRHMTPLGLGAGFVDATGGGGWGPVATPTLLSTGKIEPRKVVGSVDTSEFVVALAASAGFLLALGHQGIDFTVVAALLAGGLVAAPLAAWLVQRITAGLLGSLVGGLIVVTNVRTMFSAFEVAGAARWPAYAAVAAIWALAVGIVVRRHRRNGIPLTSPRPQRPVGQPAQETAG
ncbi:MAG TPA: sulfite exporter TauE/SafE family protein [Gaiellaceae bacterium]|nr:sulfite exporter TauE/SafE family protein [Gaiellaceae bacterium]